MAGMLSDQNIPRYVIPHEERSIDITVVHPLEQHMAQDGQSRGQANNAALHQLREVFAKEGLFYVYEKDAVAAKGVVQEGQDEPVEVGMIEWMRRSFILLSRKISLKRTFPHVSFS